MVIAELPDGTELEFPEGTSPDVVQSTVKRILQVPPTTGELLGAGVDQVQAGLYGAAYGIGDLVGSEAVKQFGLEGAAQNLRDASQITSRTLPYTEALDSLGNVGRFARENITLQAPYLASFIGPGLALKGATTALGARMGLSEASAATLARYAPFAATSLPQFYGSNINRQLAEGSGEVDQSAAMLAAVGQSALEATIGRFIPDGAVAVSGPFWQRLAKKVGEAIVLEPTTEVGQQVLERMQAGIAAGITDPEALEEYISTAAAVLPSAVLFGGVSAMPGRQAPTAAEEKPPVQRETPPPPAQQVFEGNQAAFATPSRSRQVIAAPTIPQAKLDSDATLNDTLNLFPDTISVGQKVEVPGVSGKFTVTGMEGQMLTVRPKKGDAFQIPAYLTQPAETFIPRTEVEFAPGETVRIEGVSKKIYTISAIDSASKKLTITDNETQQSFPVDPFILKPTKAAKPKVLKLDKAPEDTVIGQTAVVGGKRGTVQTLNPERGTVGVDFGSASITEVPVQQVDAFESVAPAPSLKPGDTIVTERGRYVYEAPSTDGASLQAVSPEGEKVLINPQNVLALEEPAPEATPAPAKVKFTREVPSVVQDPDAVLQGAVTSFRQSNVPLNMAAVADALKTGSLMAAPNINLTSVDFTGLVTTPDNVATQQDLRKFYNQWTARQKKMDLFGFAAESLTQIAQRFPVMRPLAAATLDMIRFQSQHLSDGYEDLQKVKSLKGTPKEKTLQQALELQDQAGFEITEVGEQVVPEMENYNYIHTSPGQVIQIDEELLSVITAYNSLGKKAWNAYRAGLFKMLGQQDLLNKNPQELRQLKQDLRVQIDSLNGRVRETTQRLEALKDNPEYKKLKKAGKQEARKGLEADRKAAENQLKTLTRRLDAVDGIVAYDANFKAGRMPHIREGNFYATVFKVSTNDEGKEVREKVYTTFYNDFSSGVDRLVNLGFKDNSKQVRAMLEKKFPAPEYEIVRGKANRNKMERELLTSMRTLDGLIQNMGNLNQDVWASFIDDLRENLRKQGFAKFLEPRKNIPGYIEDPVKAMEAYYLRSARAISRLHTARDFDEALRHISDNGSELENKWARDIHMPYLHSVVEELQTLKNISFIYTLGFRASPALLNVMSLPGATIPVLSKAFPIGTVLKELTKTLPVLSSITPKRLDVQAIMSGMPNINFFPAYMREDVKKAYANGILASNVTMEQAMGIEADIIQRNAFGKASAKTAQLASVFMVGTEMFNRFVTWTAAYQLLHKNPKAKAEIIKQYGDDFLFQYVTQSGLTPATFADFAVTKTQFVGHRFDRPAMMRNIGPLGGLRSLFFQFMMWPVKYLELIRSEAMGNTPQARVAAAGILAFLAMFGGITALPVMGEATDLTELLYNGIIARMAGTSKIDVNRWMTENLGEPLTFGPIASAIGVDLSSRIQPRMVPQALFDIPQALISGENINPRTLLGLAGPSSAFLISPIQAMKMYQQGNDLAALEALLPVVGKDALKVMQSMSLSSPGILSTDGKVLMSQDEITNYNRVLLSMGFAPFELARRREELWQVSKLSAETRMRGQREKQQLVNAYVKIIMAQRTGDRGAAMEGRNEVERILQEIREHNDRQTDPAKTIQLDLAAIRRGIAEQINPNAPLRNVPKRAREEAATILERGE